MIKTTDAQKVELRKAIAAPNALINEKVWTCLVASLFAGGSDQSRLFERLCGIPLPVSGPLDIWLEAEPISSRKGTEGQSEGNTKVDLAFGHVQRRGTTDAGIAYGPHQSGSWVCFVEAKCLADASGRVSYDPLRNQLARVIENLLCFQSDGAFPDRLFFALLTPRLFKSHPTARLYGYKMDDYTDPAKLLDDIETCSIPKRRDAGYTYPDLVPRLDALTLNWVCYEDLLEPECGTNLDIVAAPERVAGVKERITAALGA